MKILTFHNRAWKGIRAYNNKPLKTKDRNEHIFEIMWHSVKGRFAVSDEVTYTRRKGKPTYGGQTFYGCSLKECFQWIEETFNVKCIVDDEKEFSNQELYALEDGKRTFPIWNKGKKLNIPTEQPLNITLNLT